MLISEYPNWDATDITSLIKTKEITAQEVLASAIYMIENYNPHLNAIIYKMYEQANYYLSIQNKDSALYGIPIVLKDLWANFQATPTTYGSKLFINNIAQKDSSVVEIYKKIGLNPIAKTNTPEFGLNSITEPILYGATKNPWNFSLSPGGSSGGSAAAVASRMVPIAHASDAGGSIRGPAACCGLFGLKPTNEFMQLCFKLSPLNGLAVEHVITRSVRDSKLIYNQLFSRFNSDNVKKNKYKIGILLDTPFNFLKLSNASYRALDIAIEFFEVNRFDYSYIQCNFPTEINLPQAYLSTVSRGTRDLITQLLTENSLQLKKDQLEAVTYLIYLLGKNNRHSQEEILEIHQKYCKKIDELFDKFDILITPALINAPPKIGSLNPNYLEKIILNLVRSFSSTWLAEKLIACFSNEIFSNIAFFPLFNITGHPAATIPIYFDNELQMPISIQLIAPKWKECYIFDLAEKIEEFFPCKEINPNSIKEQIKDEKVKKSIVN